MNKLCNSLQYWKKKLKPAVEETSILVTLFNHQKDVKTDLFSLITAIESLHDSFIVTGFAGFRNPRYLCFYFENKDVRNKVMESFKMVEDNFVVYMSWAMGEEALVSTLSVHWLPLTTDIDYIKKELDKYVTIIEQERMKLTFMSGRSMPSGKVSFKVRLKKDVRAENIPHLTEMGNMETLITISGRLPLCLNCNVLGHISKDCGQRYCKSCRALMPKAHSCSMDKSVTSYADKVKQRTADDSDLEPDDWGAKITHKDNSNFKGETATIEKKIIELEKQINFSQAAESFQAAARLEKKRKTESSMAVSAVDQELQSLSDGDQEELGSASDESHGEQTSEKEEEESMQTDNTLVNNNSVDLCSIEKKNGKKGKNKVTDDSKIVKVNSKNTEASISALNSKTYGRTRANTSKIDKQNKQFDKLLEKREFVFKE